jgi:hypothetical protein
MNLGLIFVCSFAHDIEPETYHVKSMNFDSARVFKKGGSCAQGSFLGHDFLLSCSLWAVGKKYGQAGSYPSYYNLAGVGNS